MLEPNLVGLQSTSLIVSLVSLVSVTTLILLCGVCRKIFKKKKGNNDKTNVVENPEIELAENGDCEKGISNPAYDTNLVNDQKVDQESEEDVKQEDISNHNNENHTADVENPKIEENHVHTVEEEIKVTLNAGLEQEPPIHAPVERVDEREIVNVDDGSLHGKQMQDNESGEDIVENTPKEINDETNENKGTEDDEEEAMSSSSESSISENFDSYDGLVLQGGWRKMVVLRDLLEAGLVSTDTIDDSLRELTLRREELIEKRQAADVDEDVTLDPDDDDYIPLKLRPLLCGEEPVAGIIVSESGEKKSIYRSAKEGLLRRGTAISLLEAQAATGNIIDPITGRKMSVTEATQLGLLDKVYETVLTRAERAVTGYKTRASEDILSLFQAMQKGLVVESHGLRLLEAQYSTGGLIDHRINSRLPTDFAIKRGIIDENLRTKLEEQDLATSGTFFDPNTEESVTYKELMRRSVLDTDTGLRLYPLENIGRKRYSYGSYSGRSSLASSRSLSRTSSRESLHLSSN